MIPGADQKLNLLLIFTFCYKYLKYKKGFIILEKAVLYLICNRINGFVGVLNGKAGLPA